MGAKLNDRERKYRAAMLKAKAEAKAASAQAERMRSVLLKFDGIMAELKQMQQKQDAINRRSEDRMERLTENLYRLSDMSAMHRTLLDEVNAHMWRSGNRLDALRDIVISRMVPLPKRGQRRSRIKAVWAQIRSAWNRVAGKTS